MRPLVSLVVRFRDFLCNPPQITLVNSPHYTLTVSSPECNPSKNASIRRTCISAHNYNREYREYAGMNPRRID